MRTFLVLLLLAIGGIVGMSYYNSTLPSDIKYVTDRATLTDITVSVAVTGVAEPTEVRHVQGETFGVVKEILVDENDEVHEGEQLARLSSEMERVELSRAKAELATAQAAVKIAEAGVQAATAGVTKAQAELEGKRIEYDAVKKLYVSKNGNNAQEGSIVSKSQVDSKELYFKGAQGGLEFAMSEMTKAQAALETAHANVQAAEIAVAVADLKLDKTVLKSNMKGMILSKDITKGDLVGRPKLNLSAGPMSMPQSEPALFKISAPLDQMQAIVKVNEADSSAVRKGQHATFTVDAYPDEGFEATVDKVGYAPSNDRTAVSYDAVLLFKNRRDPETGDWMVRPGATVSADIVIRTVTNIVAVPNLALQFQPSDSEIEVPQTEQVDEQIVWTLSADNRPTPMVIQTGVTDGTVTQVIGDALSEGDAVITHQPASEASSMFKLPIAP